MTRAISLDDKYRLESGRIYLNGTQSLVRLLLMQRWRDRALGLRTAGFVSGYRGSPLAGLDQALWQAKPYLTPENIVFQPGLNEELGVTAVWGSQQVGLFPGAKFQGVYGMWYGKGPGVDRSGDGLKHANAAGTSPYGGVLALAGDDHLCKSSSLPHQSEYAFVDAMMPVLNPSDIRDIIEMGLLGWGMSRYSGCWVGVKLTGETVDTTVSLDVPSFLQPFQTPEPTYLSPAELNIRWPDAPLDQEKRLLTFKLPAAQDFAYANGVDRVIVGGAQDVCGIITTGKSYLDVRQALSDLGLDEQALKTLGIRLYKVGLTWPLEPKRLLEFADGLQAILVVEEKRPLMEGQVKELFYNRFGGKISIMGKQDEVHQALLPVTYELKPLQIALAIGHLLKRVGRDSGVQDRLAAMKRQADGADMLPVEELKRIAYYCSGCPHNTSTKTPEGSRTVAGIGCHYMAMWIDDATATFSQMGGEGVSWLGQAPFTQTPHIFANMGDGTYYHSGSLAIRAAVAAQVNITFKILFNDAVAMTGGQPVDGPLTVSRLTHQLAAEGVMGIAVVSDDVDKYPIGVNFAPKTTVHHRRDLQAVQLQFRETAGVTVIVYDQTCAAEKRRRRKRGLMVDPAVRVFINESVCEGCGDCGKASNCLSILPKETEFGRKRMIDQSSCNKDMSCIEGFCPSFVTIEGTKYQPETVPFEAAIDLPHPSLPDVGAIYSIVVAGIGGTGVVTMGALLAMAAHVEEKGCTVLDMTGLSQKGGAVTSHVKIGPSPQSMKAARIAAGEAHAILGADLLVAGGGDVLPLMGRGKTTVALNVHPVATGDFTKNPDQQIPADALIHRVEACVGESAVKQVNMGELSSRLFGDSLPANMMLLGFAYQHGLIPVKAESIEQAIRMNKVDVQGNLKAFSAGRRAAHDQAWAESIIGSGEAVFSKNLDEMVDGRVKFLTAYQNEAYGLRYKDLVDRVRGFEAKHFPGQEDLSKAVALYYHKVLAYKDEYEVARLYAQTDFIKTVKSQMKDAGKLSFHLAPPLFAHRDPVSGHLRKKKYGPWILKVFRVLAKLKGLRGTWLDPFGYTQERRAERQLIADYEGLVEEIMTHLQQQEMAQDAPARVASARGGVPAQGSSSSYEKAVAMACFPETIRGFGHVKEKALREAYAALAAMRQVWPSGREEKG